MASYVATVRWSRREGEKFTDNRYSRAHRWEFDGGAVVPASASPHVMRPPLSDPKGVDPEEALVASLASCHMLFFLYFAARQGFEIDSYIDEAVGEMVKRADGREWLAVATLRPRIAFAGPKRPDAAAVDALHHEAHEACYIANSVKTEVRIESRNEGLA